MSIERFKDVRDMPPPPKAGKDDLARRIAAVWQRAGQLALLGYPPGVYKFRTQAEAQAAREEVVKNRCLGRKPRH